MAMCRVILIKILLIISICDIMGQPSGVGPSLRPLMLGDKAPDYEFTTMINYKSKIVKLSDFKGKLVILDFWNTSCGSCIASWPHLLDIQKEFEGKIQIILVNPVQNEETVRKAFERRKKVANVDMTLPAVCYDADIVNLFPVSGVPHVVWLDGDRVVKSVTYSSSINSNNINALLRGEEVNMPQKINNSEYIPATFQKPLFLNDNGGKPKEIYAYSFFGKGDDKLYPTYGLVSSEKRHEYYIVLTNYCLLDFYKLAYSNRKTHLGLEMILPNRTLLRASDSVKYVEQINGEIIRDNLFVYQVIAPPSSLLDLQKIMQSDLDRYVGLDAKWVKMKRKCLVLTATDTSLISYRSGSRRAIINETNIDLNQVSLKYFLDFLEDGTDYYWSPYPLIDETNFKGLLGSIAFETNVSDYRQLDKALRKYGMRLSLEDRVVDILVVSDQKEKPKVGRQF